MKIEKVIENLGKTSYITTDEAKIMYEELLKLPDGGRMLELGTGMGHSTRFFSNAKPDWIVYTVDSYGTAGAGPHIYSCKEMEGGGRDAVWNINTDCLKNVIQIICSFQDLPWELDVNALFIDGSHWYKDIKEDWDKFGPFVIKGGLVMFHDYTPTYDVREFMEKEVKPDNKWKVWDNGGIGFAKRL